MRKLTITVSDEVYKGLYARIGSGKISRFIDSLARPHVIDKDIDEGYRAMAEDHERERQALEWSETLAGEAIDETR